MILEGDDPTGQPAEGVDALDDIANALIGGSEEDEQSAPAASEEDEASDDAEGSDEPEEEAEETEEDEEEQTFTIKHDGKDVTLKQSELVEMAQKGFDYTNKTMAVAKERETVQAERATATQYRQHHEQVLGEQLQRLQALEQFLVAQVGDPPPLSLAQENAQAFLVQKEMHDRRVGTLQQVQQAIQQTHSETQRQRQAWIEQQAGETERALQDTLPGWNDDMLNDYAKYAAGLGLTAQTADVAFVQKGFWELVHKAKAFDALQAKKAEMKPTAKLTKVVKPAANNQSGKVAERVKREAAFNKNPTVDALAELLR